VIMTDQVELLGDILMTCVNEAVSGMDPSIAPLDTCFRIGSEVPYDADNYYDMCCRGLAYVSLGDIWPSSASFPEADIVRQASAVCYPPAWGVQWKTGIIRCAPVGYEGNQPTCADWTSAYLKAVADARALRQIACCFRATVRSTQAFRGLGVVIERQVQGPPQGGCVERYVTISVQMSNCDCPGQT
jgi:hypothetical protein